MHRNILLVAGLLFGFAYIAPGDEWYTSYRKNLDGDTQHVISAICPFNDRLYMLAGSKQNSGYTDPPKVLRRESEACAAWQDVSPPFRPEGSLYRGFLAAFNGRLYAGGSNLGVFSTADGENWERITQLPVDNYCAATSFGDYLLLCGGRSIYRSTNGTDWASSDLSLIEPDLFFAESIAVHGNAVYVGGSLKNLAFQGGVAIFASRNAVTWQEVFKEFPTSNLQHIHGMCSFQGMLYFGEYHGGGVYRTPAFPELEYFFLQLPMDIAGLAVHDGKLFAAGNQTTMDNLGDPIVYYSADGTNWTSVPGCPIETNGLVGAASIVSVGDTLYVGDEALGLGRPLSLHAYAPQLPPACETPAMFGALMELDALMAASETASPLWDVGRYYVTDTPPFVASLPPVAVAKQVFSALDDERFSFLERLVTYPAMLDGVEDHYLAFVSALASNNTVVASNELHAAHTMLLGVMTNVAAVAPPAIVALAPIDATTVRLSWTNCVMPSRYRVSVDPAHVVWTPGPRWTHATGGSEVVALEGSNAWFNIDSLHWHPEPLILP